MPTDRRALGAYAIGAVLGVVLVGAFAKSFSSGREGVSSVDIFLDRRVSYQPGDSEIVVPVRVENSLSRTVRIDGAEVSCECARVAGVPLCLPPGGSGVLSVHVGLGKGGASDFTVAVRLLGSSMGSQPVFHLALSPSNSKVPRN